MPEFFTINQVTKVSITEWLGADEWTRVHGLSTLIKNALYYEAEKIIQDRNREQSHARKTQEMKEMQDKAYGSMPALSHNLGGIKNYLS